MRKRLRTSKRRPSEGGYALLLVVFLTTLLLLTTIVAAPSVRTERQREKEEEMVWRGKQYVRAIKLYYRKNGKFPTSLDDLTQPKMGSLRYLRQAYKDPMNKEDGSWRLIFVGPAGQLIGSTKPPQTLQLQGVGGPGGTQPGSPGASAFGSFGSTPGANGNTPQGAAGAQPGGAAAGAAGTTQPGTGTGPGTGTTDTSAANPDAPAPVDTSNFIGGNIIGIGSKAKQNSIMIYEKATNYHQFEFIWDPSKDTMAIGGTGTQIGTPTGPGVPPGQGFGQGFGQGPGTFGAQPAPSPQPMGGSAPGQPGAPPSTPNTPPQ
jgi:hypothetical protein